MRDSRSADDRLAANSAFTADDQPSTDGQAVQPVDQALLGGAPQRVGRFEYHYASDTWTWSDTVAIIHGYEPGQVKPTTELVLNHKHPDDLAQVKGLLKQSAAPFSSRHRIHTTTGELRSVVVVGDAILDDGGSIVATRGFYVDVTESLKAELEQSVSAKLHMIVAHREIIDQAKGMLMMAYQISADSAFGILRWRSQELNVKLLWIAEKIVAEVPALMDTHANVHVRIPIDHYLMTLTPPDTISK
ncbi:PAS and ANTAR domain-containing protein [Mycolicibacterium hodleri]|uniref:PAS and ANTAR domain-containing protein n=1 Tax=Mycolicibacterium hodleri TaxID=49897 RepID=UPI001375C5FA|nr:PAS and ANTAR domain-containing protein [Mycolicibacterium hodleri]